MMIFITPQDADNRFVIFLNTKTCKVFYNKEGLYFESSPSRIEIIKDFLINYGVRDIEVKERPDQCQILVHDKDTTMQLDDLNNITGLKVPVLTII